MSNILNSIQISSGNNTNAKWLTAQQIKNNQSKLFLISPIFSVDFCNQLSNSNKRKLIRDKRLNPLFETLCKTATKETAKDILQEVKSLEPLLLESGNHFGWSGAKELFSVLSSLLKK